MSRVSPRGRYRARNSCGLSEPAGADNSAHAVRAQRQTNVTVNPVIRAGQDLYSATVVITYTYRKKTYRVQLNAMRASDV